MTHDLHKGHVTLKETKKETLEKTFTRAIDVKVVAPTGIVVDGEVTVIC